MYLKAVELFGFKSFADKTVVHFNPGITCVVGPNGCGKSNISDAIRWVLGERSAKLLRGTKMEDVIFAGTSFRKPVNMSEVSLVIDNRDKILNIGYDEVVITRRLFRTGESEYYINKTLCRYKDIQDLLMDTGIGSHSYSMIEQGRIDYILQADPEERRFLIEEAAGISRYNSQKEEAIRKLERTETNLLRLTDIVAEVERNIKYAERQAKRVEKYKEYYETLKRIEIQKALHEKRALENRKKEIEETRAASQEKERQLTDRVESLRRTLFQFEKEEEEKLQEIRFKESGRFEIKSEIQTKDSAKEFNSEKIGEIRNQIETLEREIHDIEANKNALAQSISEKETELQNFKVRSSHLESEYAEVRTRYEALESQIRALEDGKRQYQSLVFERAGLITSLRNRIHELEVMKASIEISGKKNHEDLKLSEEESASLRIRTSELTSNVASKQSALYTHQIEHGDLLSQAESASQKLAAAREEKEILVRELQEITSRIELTRQFEEALLEKEGLSRELQEKLNSLEFKARLFKELSIESGYEKAVESALGPVLRSIVVENQDELGRLADALRAENFTKIPVIVADHSAADFPQASLVQAPFSIVPFADKARPSARVSRLLALLFQNVYFVDGEITVSDFLAFQAQYPAIRLLQKNGQIWGPGNLMYLKGPKEEESLLVNQSEWESHLKKKTEKEGAIAGSESQIGFLEHELEEKRTRVHEKFDRLRSVQFELEQDEKDLFEANESAAKNEKEHAFYLAEAERIQAESERLHRESAQDREDILKLEEEERASRADFEKIESELLEKKRERESLYLKKSAMESEKAALDEKLKFTEVSLSLVKTRIQEEDERRERSQERIAEGTKKAQEIRLQNEELETRLREYREKLKNEELELHFLEEERLKLQEKKKSILEETGKEEKALEESRLEIHRLEMESREIVHLGTREQERLAQVYKINLDECVVSNEELDQLDLPRIGEEIKELSEKVASVGTVNLLAIEEYEELKTRFEFLNSQKNDLEKAKTELLEAIRRINRTTRRLFQETYEQVRTNFAEFFRLLFGGGRAELVILDEENPLDSGIDIFAQPPGKKNQNISLLSGGEKALTAIALLFSLFKIKPSPFSVLDEIDAPLDEANIDRFLDMLKTFSQNTQFIIVTHNRKTISMGSQLYGVTMQEAGVSKIVSVKLQDSTVGEKQEKSVTEQSLATPIGTAEEN